MAFYFGVFKEPRGLIRLLQFIFTIFAFATACSGDSFVAFKIVKNGTNTTGELSWDYPYHLQDTFIEINSTKNNSASDANDIKPSAEFFVFTGVTSMLLTLALCVVYVVLDRLYRSDQRFPIGDLIISLLWTIFWLAGSSAWAQGVSNLRAHTSFDHIFNRIPNCQDGSTKCIGDEPGTYANVIVSVIFGFLNFFLWICSLWFVYKETRYFRSRTAQQQQHPYNPNTFANIAVPPQSYPTYPEPSNTIN